MFALAIGFAPKFGFDPALAMGSDSLSAPSADDNYREAVQLVEAKRYRPAISLFEKVLREKPRHTDALNYIGYSHRQLKDYELAVRYYNRALEIDPNHRGANEYLGEAYLETGKLDLAEARLAHLNAVCGMNCKEYQQLAAAVANYKAGRRPPQSSRAW
jgi:tetratricopeptide (TPR) repeat protein